LGSSTGELRFVVVEINDEGCIESHVKDNCITVAENSMIYSIASEKDSDLTGPPRLWVGYASGLAVVENYL